MKQEGTRFRKANPVRLDRILGTVVDSMGIGTDIHLKRIMDHWRVIVGQANANNTRPVSLRDGVLVVSVSSPSWNAQARFFKTAFLKKIRQFEPERESEVRDIRFVLERY